METAFEQLRSRLAEISDLGSAGAILAWDQQVMMPARGAFVRAEQLATIGRIAHEKFIAPEVGKLLDELEGFEQEHDYDSFEASLIRVVRADYAKASKVPAELRAEIARASSLALPVWAKARRENDFDAFRPLLERNLELRRRYIACFDGDFAEPYDVLLDDYERGMTSAELRTLFDYLKAHQVPLIREVSDAGAITAAPHRPFPIAAQKQFEREIVGRFGFDEAAWRLDPTVHPFATRSGLQDIRITTRYFDDSLDGLFATMHETGHGLYEHQVDPALERTPLGYGTSLGIHESQSRMWENLVGRSLPFWRFVFPRARELFPEALAGLDAEGFYREVNSVRPSLIRVEADETTYNLHVLIRFELEQEMLAGSFPLSELPAEWNRRMWEYLGVEVPDDTHGVLQDTHWAGGSIGYFPTYTLGNLISVQLWERIVSDVPDIDEQFGRGEFGALRDWLREHVHRHGRKFSPRETLERATGAKRIEPAPYIRYLQEKVGAIYGLPLGAQS